MLNIPNNLKLYDFQKRDCKFFVRRGGGFCASEMGTGKTPIGVVFANSVKPILQSDIIPTLIVCPAVMRLTWAKEFELWSTRKWNIQILKKLSDLPDPETDLCIVSYTYIAEYNSCQALCKHYDFDTLICDEWHYCKNNSSKRTKFMLKYVLKKPTYKLCLTGTPITRAVTDLWTQLYPFVPPEILGRYWDFCSRFSYRVDTGFGIEFQGIRNEDKLLEICKPFMRRRLKKKVLKQLPPKIFRNVYADIPKKLADESLNFVDIAMSQIAGVQSKDVRHDKDRFLHVATIKRELGLAKVRTVVEYTLMLLKDKPCCVLFAYHKDVIATIVKSLQKKRISVADIQGSTPTELRQKRVELFQEGIISVLVCNMVAGGVGITLTRADHCVICELDWTPAVISQAMDRLHRITQENTVQVDFMLAKDSLDQQIIGSLRTKLNIAKRALGDA